ncbi:uncharacterized protein LOC127249129 [Andrographis paniculata]|uniref:uncharacterized protein LOC127249129 n=1 Tax=Andrographis paniculata TaxID=175694 RepID=UPI0021E766DB|nr:uncharacterized protein LOC127249129 [Andrographis paniculata]
MTNSGLFFNNEDPNLVAKSAFCWWRTLEEFDENGHFKVKISDLSSNLTPRLRVLREMERLAFVAGEGLDELRHRLISYRSGDFCLPVGGIEKSAMDIPPVITILLTGMIASGKSAFVNMMYSVLGRSGVIPFAQTSPPEGEPTTMYLEEHNVLRSSRSGFCVYDTRGLDQTQMDEGLADVSEWLSGGVKHNHPCLRPHDHFRGGGGAMWTCRVSSSRFIKRQVNCVMVVADLSQIQKSFKSGNTRTIQAIRDLFRFTATKNSSNENPILILTHGDTLTAEERINGRLRICEYLGIVETSGAYDIPCLTEQGIVAEESDPVAAFALTEAVYRALLQSDRTHQPKRKFKDYIILLWSWIMASIAAFFALLAKFFSRFGHQKLKM